MKILQNPFRGMGLGGDALADIPFPSTDASAPLALLARCPRAAQTPLHDAPEVAAASGVAVVRIKDERGRMGLGSFKALGAAYVIARDAAEGRAQGQTYVTASAGNHGLSVAAGAAAFGAQAVIYIAETVPESFADRLRGMGAEVVRSGATYEASMEAAMQAAGQGGHVLLSDSSWAGYTDRPYRVMEGYLALMAEVLAQIDVPPTHLFLQAGVGGLAGAAAAIARQEWGDQTRIMVVEPEAAPALIASIEAGMPVETTGPVSAMGRLDCKVPSLIALKGLARDADDFVTITEAEGTDGAARADTFGFATTPSGGAGMSVLLTCAEHRATLGLDASARVLVILSEGPDG
ncbi:pyridoxal-phosphate dependent enzyme [Tateyamaria pelophila]|uniref:pyridoxal-phosphate dependent enzyme n=1 Tax=Tateyamaria pelophila TaxID=328415 RepID=UPI001CBD70CC|nr:pyridoxal-phosphate dependent enzyme [Tateyamaria pelophila]